MRIDVLNGVNLDMLGRRDRQVYGSDSLRDLETQICAWALELELQVRCRQTNHEGEYVEFIHAALDTADALEPFGGPVVEVHLSDVDGREEWRHRTVLEGLTTGRVTGHGFDGYRQALSLLAERRNG